jgi:hypothetical protein
MKSSKESKIVSIKKVSSKEKRYDLTVAESSRYFANGILVHNTDGQNIMVSWKNGQLVAARNKGHLKNAGENSLSASALSQMFAGRGNIEKAFNEAMRDLSKAIGSLSEADKKKYFDDGKKFASVEVITPITQNIIPYGQNMLVFHGVIEYDKEGLPVGEDKQAGRDLGRLIGDVNAAVQKTFFVRGPQDIASKPLPNTKSRASYYAKKLSEIMRMSGTNPSSSVEDYVLGMGKKILQEEASKAKITIPAEYLDGLSRRIADVDKGYTVPQIRKDLGDNSGWFLELLKSRGKEIKRKVYAPLENMFLEIGTEVMKNMSAFLAANPTAAADSMRKDIESAISRIRTDGDEKDVEKLEHELARLTAAGGLESVVPTEGVTFVYNGKLYKYTGIFAPINQIRGMLTYK